MKKIILISGLFVFLFFNTALSQDLVIEINNTNIAQIDTIDFGDISEVKYQKIIIKNNRNSTVKISEVITPSGFGANLSEMNIGADKKVVLYVGLDPRMVDFANEFSEKIVIKTNLIIDIEINIKGNIIE